MKGQAMHEYREGEKNPQGPSIKRRAFVCRFLRKSITFQACLSAGLPLQNKED